MSDGFQGFTISCELCGAEKHGATLHELFTVTICPTCLKDI